jgi:hypothetical protein
MLGLSNVTLEKNMAITKQNLSCYIQHFGSWKICIEGRGERHFELLIYKGWVFYNFTQIFLTESRQNIS